MLFHIGIYDHPFLDINLYDPSNHGIVYNNIEYYITSFLTWSW